MLFHHRGHALVDDCDLDPHSDSPTLAELERAYREHIEAVVEAVPPSRLLIFNVETDGYAELCAFLEVDADTCPESRFPHNNDRRLFDSATNVMVLVVRAWGVLRSAGRLLIRTGVVVAVVAAAMFNYYVFKVEMKED